jgi:NAD+ kinase
MENIRTIGIISKANAPLGPKIVPGLLAWLRERNIEVRYDKETAAYAEASDWLSREELPKGCQFIIVLGGDGTLLSAARAIKDSNIPVLGVNFGSLGFLTAITADELYPELERALQGKHRIGHRAMLDCTLMRGTEKVGSYIALNDIVVSKNPGAQMIELETNVGNHHICTYKADGLIVATPTGSTAYSLSAGGPIVFPQVEALAITPICPHMLTNRPVIVPNNMVIQIISRAGAGSAHLTVDGQIDVPLESEDRVICKASKNLLRLIRPPRLLYFDVLRQKLKWGER